MRVIPGTAERGPYISLAFVAGALGVLFFTILGGFPVLDVAPAIGLVIVSAVWHREIFAWRALLAGLVLVILFIPIRRYALPGNLPFELEPYRLFVAFVAAGWLASLLVDPRVRFRRGPFDGPLFAIIIAILASVIVNGGRIHTLGVGDVVNKKLTFAASFFLVVYLMLSVLRAKDVQALVKVLVGGGAAVAVAAVVEYRIGFNVFNNLFRVLPLLELTDVLDDDAVARGGRQRAYASAQHPIALGAMLVMLLPLALYLARSSGRRRWWLAAGLLALGALATLSRTSVLMLVVIIVAFLWLRPRETKRLWPLLLPAMVLVHLALPGTIGTLKASFLPTGGLIAEQQQGAGGRGSGRVADVGPSLAEFSERPILGQGYGTRLVDEGPRANALILDNQWLGTLLETGLMGGLAWLWLFVRAARRFGAAAKREPGPAGWLATGLAASTAAFAVGMFTFDAFSFIQVMFVLFILLGLGSVGLVERAKPARRTHRAATAP